MNALYSPVSNRGVPHAAFLQELISWGRTAPESIFAVNDESDDIYTRIRPVLGPWVSILHRRAAMLEVLRVLAGMESSWDWNCGRDTTNSTSVTPDTIEAGVFQVSANSRAFGDDLRLLAPANGTEFQRVMKVNHPLAMEYAARLLRHTGQHNGPVKRNEILTWLRRAAVTAFEAELSA